MYVRIERKNFKMNEVFMDEAKIISDRLSRGWHDAMIRITVLKSHKAISKSCLVSVNVAQ